MDRSYVEAHTVFLTQAGSRAYGTALPDSDIDIRGVCLMTDPRYYFGTGTFNFEQWTSKDPDEVVYDFRKAIKLIADANPNMIELLYTPEQFWIHISPAWSQVIAKREIFLSKRMRHTYGGYAYAQLRRIRNHRRYLLDPPKTKPTRATYGLPERRLLSSDDLGAFQWLIASLLKGSVEELNLSEQAKEELNSVNYIGLVQRSRLEGAADALQRLTDAPHGYIDMVLREKSYASAMADWDAYQAWQKNRNPKRAELEAKYGFDTKHASHLVRLMRMGCEVLAEGRVEVYRQDREELIAIRNGAWSYEKLVAYAEESEERLKHLEEISALPKCPNVNAIEELTIQIVQENIL